MPFLVKGSAGPVISPYLRACNQCLVLLARYAAELGFSPAARASLGRPADDDRGDGPDEWAALRKLRLIDGGKE